MIKRYLVFGYEYYYPSGGWNDFVSAHDDYDEAMAAADKTKADWTQVVDLVTLADCRDPNSLSDQVT